MTTIIVADDDIPMLEALKVRLESEGFEVHAAQDSYAALHLAREHDADLLVLDINMPAGDGFSVQERMSKVPSIADVPVIYVTGEHSEHVSDEATRLGAFALVHKPFETEELLKVVREAIAARPVAD